MTLSTARASFVDSPEGYVEPGRCARCNGNGFWLTPAGIVTECPNWQLRFNDHPAPNPAAEAVLRAGRRLQFAGVVANPIAVDVARGLTKATTDEPLTRDVLLDRYILFGTQRLRALHAVIEELRGVWLLPVGSRKTKPFGYWIITDEADFRAWVERATSAPIRQLTTIHAVARANFPVFARQLEFDFWSDMDPDSALRIPHSALDHSPPSGA